MTVDFTNISSRPVLGYIQVDNGKSVTNFPLYAVDSLPSSIILADDGTVKENWKYSLRLLLPPEIELSNATVSVNGGDALNVGCSGRGMVKIAKQRYRIYELVLTSDGSYPFWLTFGFARLEVRIDASNGRAAEATLSTCDIPCESNTLEQGPLIRGMLDELLDTEGDDAIQWMFTGRCNECKAYSILDAAFVDNAPKSLNSMIQLLEAVSILYKSHLSYFNSHGFSRIVQVKAKVAPANIRRIGHNELQWIARNMDALSETKQETNLVHRGRFYTLRYIETNRKVKTYNSYENRLVLGFLREATQRARAILQILVREYDEIAEIESKLNSIADKGAQLPAAILLSQYVARGSGLLERLRCVTNDLERLFRFYRKALPEVECVFSMPVRKTKIFQEVQEYSSIYDMIQLWNRFGDFSLAREQLALHALRLDKLYEYYVLYKLLKELKSFGFEKDYQFENPVLCAEYSVDDGFYANERQVATQYNLCMGHIHITLYYQPVIYADLTEENGITLHRLSKSGWNKDKYWMPDYLLKVCEDGAFPRWHVFDAKFSQMQTLWRYFPKEGIFAQSIAKYSTDIGSRKENGGVESVWLFAGRAGHAGTRIAEQSGWAKQFFNGYVSGIGALTPVNNCLHEVLGTILGQAETGQVPPSGTKLVQLSSESNVTSADDGLAESEFVSGAAVDAPQIELIKRLYKLVINPNNLYDSQWARRELGINRPIIRTHKPSTVERKKYRKTEIDGNVCYVYTELLQPELKRLKNYVRRAENAMK